MATDQDNPNNPDNLPEVPAEVLQVSDQQFREWRHHPVSLAVRRFLADRREALKRDHADRWLQGHEQGEQFENEARGRALECGEIADLEWPTIEQFYSLMKEDNATEPGQD